MKERTVYIVGNWKMYKTATEAVAFIRALVQKVKPNAQKKVGLAVPFTAIHQAMEAAKGSNILVGAQNMHDVDKGAFTGEIAASMLIDAGASFVILGHSERRLIFKETDEWINKKVCRALKENLLPILCIGETLAERGEKKTFEVLKNQLEKALSQVTEEQASKLIIAYEPVWAIGTGKTATSEMANEAHAFIRKCLSEIFKSAAVSEKISIIYGGSVKPENIKALMKMNEIDGVLVGGASLDVEGFTKIINYQE